MTNLLNRGLETLKIKFVSDVLWTFGGKTVAAGLGIVINILIGNHYNANGLGIYHQAFALYMILSLFSSFGIPGSTLKHAAEFKDDARKLQAILVSSLAMVLVISLLLTSAILALLFFYPGIVYNPPLANALQVILAALPLFSLNRVLISFLNGMRRMKLFAVVHPLRWGLIILFLLYAIHTRQTIQFMFYAFTLSESCLLVFLILVNRRYIRFRRGSPGEWWGIHFRFGIKTFISASINTVNRRADILMVGYFLSNDAAGLYGFASSAARGFLFIGNVMQRNFSPIVSNLWAKKEIQQIRSNFLKIKKTLFIFVLPLLVLVVLLYPVAVEIMMADPAYPGTWSVFFILMIGISLAVLFNWSGGMLSMANFLDETMKVASAGITVNIIGNILLIPLIGINGAAAATAISHFLRLLIIRHYVKTRMDIDIF